MDKEDVAVQIAVYLGRALAGAAAGFGGYSLLWIGGWWSPVALGIATAAGAAAGVIFGSRVVRWVGEEAGRWW